MEFNEAFYDSQLPIDAYGEGYFRVAEEKHDGPLLLCAKGTVPWKGLSDLAPLIKLANQVDVLFLGTGADLAPLPPDVRKSLEKAHVPFELMPSPAAARTYNVLLSEGRRVAIAALPI